nr:MAG: DNA pilot protein [Microvirus sp.]
MGWGSIIGAAFPSVAGDVIGGIISKEEGAHNRNQQDQINQRNYDMQTEFAKNSLRWKIEDAKAAGIHPLAALGAQGYSATPSYISSGPDNSMSNMARSMGQNISRAITATSTSHERAVQKLQLENMGLENELLRNRVESEKRVLSQSGPSFPSATKDTYLTGQGDIPKALGNDPRVQDQPLRRIVSDPSDSSKEAGAIPDFNFARTAGGRYVVVPAADVKQRIEDDWLAEQQWKIRAYKNVITGKIRLPDGRRAIPNPLTGELIPIEPPLAPHVTKMRNSKYYRR